MSRPVPRIVEWRLLVVGLVVGLVASALSTAATHAMAVRSWPTWVDRSVDGGFFESSEGSIHLLARERRPGVRAWVTNRTGPYWVHGSESGYFRFDEEYPTPDDRPRYAQPGTEREPSSYICVAAGWPMLCAVAKRRYAPDPGGFVVLGGMASGLVEASPELIPRTPLWGGLAINTMFYAAIFVVPIVLLRRIRMARMRRRGLCVRCRYDLSASPGVCPECGTLDRKASNRKA